MATFLAHLNVPVKHLRYKQKSSFARHVGGQEHALQHGGTDLKKETRSSFYCLESEAKES